MTHWAWYWHIKKKHRPKTLCSELSHLDSFKLFKSPEVLGFDTDPHTLKARIVDGVLRITHGKRKNYSYTIPIDKQSCYFGGFRYFFKCPTCLRRMRILYMIKGAFICRICLNLAYQSQRLRPTVRYWTNYKKIIDLVKSKGGSLDDRQKPPRMRKHTFEKLKRNAFHHQDKSDLELRKELRQWYGSKTEPYLSELYNYEDEEAEMHQ